MLKKRIIPCLDIQNGRTVKGINFLGLRDAGDPVELARRYAHEGADELVFLDITATVERRETLTALVEKVAAEINIPFTVGGGIASVGQAAKLLAAGADKVSVNSSAVRDPKLVTVLANRLGSQCVTVAIDFREESDEGWVYIKGGREKTDWRVIDWAVEVERRGAGEILLTSMNHDGTQSGFATQITQQVCNAVSLPVIASGGAGSATDFVHLFQETDASAGLAASIFHDNRVPIPALKKRLKQRFIPVR